MGKKDKEAFRPKEFYRDRIIEMVNQINRTDILEYLETFIRLYIEKWG